jgi:hypothetical protein
MFNFGQVVRQAFRMFGAPQIEVAAAIVIPLLAFVLNWAIRSQNGYALSAAPDFALALAAFDLIALLYRTSFIEVMRNETFRQSFNALEIFLFCVTLVAWIWPFLRLEHSMTRGYDFHNRCYINGQSPMGAFLLGWTILAALLAAHILGYIYE